MNAVRSDLRAFYDAEARAETRGPPSGFRVDLRDEFVERLVAEDRSSVIDIGAGPGTDAAGFGAAGIDYVGVDLAPANAVLARRRQHRVVPASLFDLPFADETFDAAWSMSTLMHVPETEVGVALHELARVVRPGAPLGIGLWGGSLGDIVSERQGKNQDQRLFSLRTADTNQRLFERLGILERFERREAGPVGWEYHFAVLRVGPQHAHD